jgi:DegV family protein with EDD domain
LGQIAIVTDSTSDLPRSEAAKHGIEIIPLSVIYQDKTYLDGIDITPDKFYPMLAEGSELPKTSQPSIGQFTEVYSRLLGQGREVISVHISKKLSSTVMTALSSVEQMKSSKVHVVDSGFLSYALAMQAIAAARMALDGGRIKDILARLAKMRERTELMFTLDTLHYLHKGGRIGKVSSLLGQLLNIKPVIRVDDGEYVTAARARSTKQALATMSSLMADTFGTEKVQVAVGHGRGYEGAIALREMLGSSLCLAEPPVLFEVGPVLGVHTGPGTIGAAVCPVS